MSKTETKKKIVILEVSDFPFNPDTGEYFTGIKSMELTSIGYDFHKYLERRINEGGLTLKEAVKRGLADYDDGWDAIFVAETDKELIFCPIGEGDEARAEDFEGIINGICALFKHTTIDLPKGTKTVCIGKVAVNGIHTVIEKKAEKANVAPLSAPMFTKL